MVKDIEKNLKRWLKRKVKITLGIVTAFLIMGISAFASNSILEITQGNNGEILFNGKIFDEETHEFLGNTFENGLYTNNSIMNETLESDGSLIEISKLNNNFTFKNNSLIMGETKNKENSIIGIAVDTNYENINIENNGLIYTKAGYYANWSEGIFSTNKGIKIINNSLENTINILNNGIIKTDDSYEGIAIYFYGNIGKIQNNGILSTTNFEEDSQNFTICTYSDTGISRDSTKIEGITNNGIINSKGSLVTGIGLDETDALYIENNGNIISFAKGGAYGIEFQSGNGGKEIFNNGILGSISEERDGQAIRVTSDTVTNFKNNGVSYSISYSISSGENKVATIGSNIKNIDNKGIIIKNTQNSDDAGVDIVTDYSKINNYGIISADIPIKAYDSTRVNNNGLFINKGGCIISYDESSKKFITQENDKNKNESNIKNEEIGKTIINAGSDGNGFVQSIKSDTIKNLSDTEGYILNGYDKTVVINSNTGDKNINNSIINAVKTAVYIEGENTLGLKDTIVNGGYGEDIILGDNNKNTLNLSGTTIINGNIDLGAGDDNLSIDNTVQLNGVLDGGIENDTLTFNSSALQENNIIVLHDIKGFENTNINTDVTLFEKTVAENGDIKNLEVQLGAITIGENGNINLRIDGTEKDGEGKVIGHSLYYNQGNITTNGGKLNLKTFGFGEEETIAFNGTDITNLTNDDITISSILHESEINGDNTISITAKKNLEDMDITNYEKLNKIYHSIVTSNLKEFDVPKEKYGEFLKYLNDIYAGTPYSYSTEISRKTLTMFDEIAISKDLNPDLKSWAIYGGLTHSDGGNKNTFFGKGYYTYDVGSIDIDADTKIYGGYAKAEYGKSENFTTGLIFGGNNSEVSLSNGSKLEGDSFYFGVYGKQKFGNLKLTAGIGVQ
ncbi:MAG: hypothetical protein SOW37_03180, partial [Fusobacterium perfoetens]